MRVVENHQPHSKTSLTQSNKNIISPAIWWSCLQCFQFPLLEVDGSPSAAQSAVAAPQSLLAILELAEAHSAATAQQQLHQEPSKSARAWLVSEKRMSHLRRSQSQTCCQQCNWIGPTSHSRLVQWQVIHFGGTLSKAMVSPKTWRLLMRKLASVLTLELQRGVNVAVLFGMPQLHC